jgi:hypothetical protein
MDPMTRAADGIPAPRRGRKPPTADEKIAALLLMYWDATGEPIPFEIAQQMTASQICSLVQWDHAVYHTWGGSTHPTNLTPRLILDHREKTAKRDVPAIAKVRRAAPKQPEPAPAAPAWLEPPRPERPKRKMRGQGFRGWRRFDGSVVHNPHWGRS